MIEAPGLQEHMHPIKHEDRYSVEGNPSIEYEVVGKVVPTMVLAQSLVVCRSENRLLLAQVPAHVRQGSIGVYFHGWDVQTG